MPNGESSRVVFRSAMLAAPGVAWYRDLCEHNLTDGPRWAAHRQEKLAMAADGVISPRHDGNGVISGASPLHVSKRVTSFFASFSSTSTQFLQSSQLHLRDGLNCRCRRSFFAASPALFCLYFYSVIRARDLTDQGNGIDRSTETAAAPPPSKNRRPNPPELALCTTDGAVSLRHSETAPQKPTPGAQQETPPTLTKPDAVDQSFDGRHPHCRRRRSTSAFPIPSLSSQIVFFSPNHRPLDPVAQTGPNRGTA